MDAVVDGYGPALDGVEDDVDEVEDEVFSDGRSNPTRRIYTLKREVLEFSRAVHPLVEVTDRLARGDLPLQAGRDGGAVPRRPRPRPAGRRAGHRPGRPAAEHPGRQRRAGDAAAERGHAQDQRLRRDPHRLHDRRRHLRDELRAHARAAAGGSATRSRWRSWAGSRRSCTAPSGATTGCDHHRRGSSWCRCPRRSSRPSSRATRCGPRPSRPFPLDAATFAGDAYVLGLRHAQLTADPTEEPWLYRAAVDRATGRVVGRIGFHAPPDPGGVVEVGYTVDPGSRRQGLALEMCRALFAWGAEHGATTVVASVSPDNAASLATVARLGLREDGRGDGRRRRAGVGAHAPAHLVRSGPHPGDVA